LNAPKISVIIPLYNAENFIRQCLISVLASKFADYEVLVVDDCSTDSSVAEVEKLLPHFGGRLKILSTEKNSGGPGVPRNIGIKNSAGKYVTFIDNDDMILPTSLENFFELAENFQADAVHAVHAFSFDDADGKNFSRDDLTLRKDLSEDFVQFAGLDAENFSRRMKDYVVGKFLWMPWGKFFRRDFLLANRIDFPQIKFSEDFVFCFKCLCLAKNYLRVPLATNIHRIRRGSVSKKVTTSREGVRNWLGVVTSVVSILGDFVDGLEFFRANPEIRRDVLKFFIDAHFYMIRNLFTTVQPHEVPKIFFDELQNPALDQRGKDIIAAHLFAEKVGRL